MRPSRHRLVLYSYSSIRSQNIFSKRIIGASELHQLLMSGLVEHTSHIESQNVDDALSDSNRSSYL